MYKLLNNFSKSVYKTNQNVIVEDRKLNKIVSWSATQFHILKKILHQEIGRDWNSYKI